MAYDIDRIEKWLNEYIKKRGEIRMMTDTQTQALIETNAPEIYGVARQAAAALARTMAQAGTKGSVAVTVELSAPTTGAINGEVYPIGRMVHEFPAATLQAMLSPADGPQPGSEPEAQAEPEQKPIRAYLSCYSDAPDRMSREWFELTPEQADDLVRDLQNPYKITSLGVGVNRKEHVLLREGICIRHLKGVRYVPLRDIKAIRLEQP